MESAWKLDVVRVTVDPDNTVEEVAMGRVGPEPMARVARIMFSLQV
jgi:hypothetical protein